MAPRKSLRTFHLMRSPAVDGVGILAIVERKGTQFYSFQEIPCDIGGRGFAVHRLDRGGVYHVRVGAPEECSCECRGFLAHNHCRHVQGLLELIEGGLLDPCRLDRQVKEFEKLE